MTNFGKSLSIAFVVIVVALVIWFVSRKPESEIVPVNQQDQTKQQTETTTTDSSDQSLDQDMTSLDAQMNALDTDTSAAVEIQ